MRLLPGPLRATAWARLYRALALWGGTDQISASIEAYAEAARRQPDDGAAWFRLGVCYRRRYDLPSRRPGDFQMAVDSCGKALALDPNQYIWRRRIQQYGPRLDKPYAFYDWVPEAEKAIRQRGQQPIGLPVRPEGAEIAQPLRDLPQPAQIPQPLDPTGQVARDREGWVRAEVTVVPAQVRPGQAARVHVALRLDAAQHAHWNNEAQPLRLWVDPPAGGQVSDRLLTAPGVRRALSDEDHALDFEVKVARGSRGKVHLSAYACYYICQGQGQCRFLRPDVPITIQLAE
jgi:tetratricopeptide (TPR) repeat protein